MAIYDRTHKVLALGENSMGTLHNTYTPRGARTRDASFWGEVFYLTGAQELRDPEAKFKGRRLMDNQDVMPYASGSLLFDYLGINFDGEKGFSYQKKLGVELVTDNGSEKYLVSFYKGTVLHDKYLTSSKEEKALPWIKLSKMELYDLGSKNLDTKHLQFENSKNEIALLEEIQSYVVDTSQYANFNIIEPLEEE